MSNKKNYPNLATQKKIAICPASGNIYARVFNAFSITGLIFTVLGIKIFPALTNLIEKEND